eukprot:Lankesteria_metandrocarpae@DN10922_c0_g1_i1.p1
MKTFTPDADTCSLLVQCMDVQSLCRLMLTSKSWRDYISSKQLNKYFRTEFFNFMERYCHWKIHIFGGKNPHNEQYLCKYSGPLNIRAVVKSATSVDTDANNNREVIYGSTHKFIIDKAHEHAESACLQTWKNLYVQMRQLVFMYQDQHPDCNEAFEFESERWVLIDNPSIRKYNSVRDKIAVYSRVKKSIYKSKNADLEIISQMFGKRLQKSNKILNFDWDRRRKLDYAQAFGRPVESDGYLIWNFRYVLHPRTNINSRILMKLAELDFIKLNYNCGYANGNSNNSSSGSEPSYDSSSGSSNSGSGNST